MKSLLLIVGLTSVIVFAYWKFVTFVCKMLDMANGCTCLKGRWDPTCPVHGRDQTEPFGDEPFPGAQPW